MILATPGAGSVDITGEFVGAAVALGEDQEGRSATMNHRIAAVVFALSSVLMPLAARAQAAPEVTPDVPMFAPPAMGDDGAEAAVAPPVMPAPERGDERFQPPAQFEGRGHHRHHRFAAREGSEGRGMEGRGRFEGRDRAARMGWREGFEGCRHEGRSEGREGFEGRGHGRWMDGRGGFEGRGHGRPMEGRGGERGWNGSAEE